jgi:hypothetical protein
MEFSILLQLEKDDEFILCHILMLIYDGGFFCRSAVGRCFMMMNKRRLWCRRRRRRK